MTTMTMTMTIFISDRYTLNYIIIAIHITACYIISYIYTGRLEVDISMTST